MELQTSKQNMIKQFIMNYIEDNNLQQGDKLFTEKYLCDTFNVSRVTVQAAFNSLQQGGHIYRIRGGGSYVGINNKSQTESLPNNGNNFIPLIICNNSLSSRSVEIISGAQDYLKSHKYHITIHSPNGSKNNEIEIIKSLIDDNVKSMIIMPFHSDINVDYYFDLIIKDTNIVFIDMLPNGLEGNLVSTNNVMGGYQITKHLIDSGFQKIAIVSGKIYGAPTYAERISGYKFALSKAGYPINNDYIVEIFADNDITLRSETPKAIENLMNLPDPPDAIFCLNDLIAFDAYNALSERNYKVPEDVALVGFDNLSLSAKNTVPITTIEQPYYQIGYNAAKICYESIFNHHKNFTRLSLEGKLIKRKSTQRT